MKNNEISHGNMEELIKWFINDSSQAGFTFSKSLINRFVASCHTQPFVIHTGLSGSGKTKLAQAFARWLTPKSKTAAFTVLDSGSSGSEVKHYELIAVGPDWTSKDSVLGYADALDAERYIKTQTLDLILRAEQYPKIPHFLIFDEMNLSHVERYFADILSSLESDEPIWLHTGETPKDGIPPRMDRLPKNLFIVGTVNVDETTYMFSPKVLDRANVIEFRVNSTEMKRFLENPNQIRLSELDGKGARFANSFVKQVNSVPELDDRETKIIKGEIQMLFNLMEEFNAEFGYRNAREIIRFVSFYKSLEPEKWSIEEAIDAQIFQKLLPKLNGSRQKIGPVLNALSAICFENHTWDEHGELSNSSELIQKARDAAKSKSGSFDSLQKNPDGDYENKVSEAFCPLSFAKIRRMSEGLDQGFTSFTEA